MKFNDSLLLQELKRDEGSKKKNGRHLVYRDSKGILTLGYGRNVQDRGISEYEATLLLDEDVLECIQDLDKRYPWISKLTDVRQRALLNMRFNMGQGSFDTFQATLAHLEAGRWKEAANNIRASKYARDVGERAMRVAHMIEFGTVKG